MTSRTTSDQITISIPAPAVSPDSPSDDDLVPDDGRPPASGSGSCCRNTLAFLFLFYNMTLNLFVLAVVHERVPSHITQPLPDIAFDVLPHADWMLNVAEYVIIAQVTAVLILMFLHRYRYVCLTSHHRSHHTHVSRPVSSQGCPVPQTVPHNGSVVLVPGHVHDRHCPAPCKSELLLLASGQ
jgi:hypothetical protein